MSKNIVAASILSADLCSLGEDIDRAQRAGADYLHFDVMDGVFVNNISYGIPVLDSVRKYTDMFLDVHLMITEPVRYVSRFAEYGADMITFHLEAAHDVKKTIDEIKSNCRWCILVSHGGEEFTSLPSPYTRDRYYQNLKSDNPAYTKVLKYTKEKLKHEKEEIIESIHDH